MLITYFYYSCFLKIDTQFFITKCSSLFYIMFENFFLIKQYVIAMYYRINDVEIYLQI